MTKLLLKTGTASGIPDTTVANTNLREDAYRLARQLLKNDEAADKFAGYLIDICSEARGKDLLIVHNPGGWGRARLGSCLEWERGIVVGVETAIQKMGRSCLLTQYFRSGEGRREAIQDLKEQFRFFESKSNIMSAWLRFIIEHVDDIKVILVGISQGAAFGSAVMQRLGKNCPVYSVELGFPFMYKSRRVITQRTLAIEGNGVRPDVLVQGNIWVGARILMAAPFRWMWYYLRGKPVAFAHCVSAPGHEYDWNSPEIESQIRVFLKVNFGVRE